MSQNKPDFFRDPIWTFIGVIIALAALLFAVFVWIVPSITRDGNSTPTPSITHTPAIVMSRTSTTNTPSPTNVPTSSSSNKPLICTSGILCSSYPMTISIISVAISGIGQSTWGFQITNNGTRAIDAYLYAYIDFDEFRAYAGELQLMAGQTQQVSVTFPAYAPVNGTSQTPKLKFEILPAASSTIYYSQTCTYLTSLNGCQS